MTQPENSSPPDPDEAVPPCPGDDKSGFRPMPCGRDEIHEAHTLGIPPTPSTVHNVHNQRRVIE